VPSLSPKEKILIAVQIATTALIGNGAISGGRKHNAVHVAIAKTYSVVSTVASRFL
jgi:hypothetical protein